jgi:FixJ family two-component response regulator
MSKPQPIVIVLDDDLSVRQSTARLIRIAGFKVQTFRSAKSFLASPLPACPACLILDVRMPDLNGLDLQRELAKGKRHLPIIFVTGHGDIPMSVQAMKAGAIEFLTKPFRDQDLINAIQDALKRDVAALEHETKFLALRAGYARLTPREREVMAGVVFGRLNKQIASELGTSEKTVKFHRAHVMQKMRAQSVADLVRMAGRLDASRQ